MISSPSSEAGQVVPKTTMFNQTCDRLREYLKEKRGLENALPSSSSFRKTMNLFPIENKNRTLLKLINSDKNIVEEDYEHAPKDMMTIFYNGQVIVVENVSDSKANEVIRAATNLSLSSAAAVANNSAPCGQLPHAIARDLSQTRSRSLTRFLEKRKERINGRAPYTLKDKSWLGLSTAFEN